MSAAGALASWWSPSTDAGVAVQVVVTVLLAALLGCVFRRERSVLLLIVGTTMVLLGWYGIRGLH